jgi:hypothetical protein
LESEPFVEAVAPSSVISIGIVVRGVFVSGGKTER